MTQIQPMKYQMYLQIQLILENFGLILLNYNYCHWN